MNKEIEAILIDIDGCIVPTDGNVSPGFYDGLEEIAISVKDTYRSNAPSIAFCSGRDRNYIEAVSCFIGLPNSWSVIESGAVLFNPATKQLRFNPALTENTKEVFKSITNERVPKFLERNSMLFLYPGNMICVALERKYGVALAIEDVYEAVKRELADLLEGGFIQITHSDCAVDITPAGIDKASGLRFLSKHTGINLKKTLGIGDSRGDFPLFREVGYVGCPDNASKECKDFIKKRKGYISPFDYADGVADIIKHFLEIKGIRIL